MHKSQVKAFPNQIQIFQSQGKPIQGNPNFSKKKGLDFLGFPSPK